MKILIVTYTYPPANSVNGFRPYYFARSLVQHGWEVEVLTRHFTGTESFDEYNKPNHTPYSFSFESGTLVHRVPHQNPWFEYFTWPGIKESGFWKLIYFFQLLFGRTTQESYSKWLGVYLQRLLATTTYDVLLVESGPTNLVRTVSKAAMAHRKPYILDFRDAYYHEMYLKDSSVIGFSKKIKLWLEKYYMRRPIASAQACISLSSTLLSILQIPADKQKIIVNGYDEEAWSKIAPTPFTGVFRITIAGTLYDRDILTIFLNGLKLFLQKGLEKVEVVFIAPGSQQVIDRIESTLTQDKLKILPLRISYEAALEHMSRSQVLAYHGWQGYAGYPSAKIYEYLRSGKKIWILPADDDIIDALLEETNSGTSFSDPVKAANQLSLWYEEWALNGKLSNASEWEKIKSYSREIQCEKLVNVLNII